MTELPFCLTDTMAVVFIFWVIRSCCVWWALWAFNLWGGFSSKCIPKSTAKCAAQYIILLHLTDCHLKQNFFRQEGKNANNIIQEHRGGIIVQLFLERNCETGLEKGTVIFLGRLIWELYFFLFYFFISEFGTKMVQVITLPEAREDGNYQWRIHYLFSYKKAKEWKRKFMLSVGKSSGECLICTS